MKRVLAIKVLVVLAWVLLTGCAPMGWQITIGSQVLVGQGAIPWEGATFYPSEQKIELAEGWDFVACNTCPPQLGIVRYQSNRFELRGPNIYSVEITPVEMAPWVGKRERLP